MPDWSFAGLSSLCFLREVPIIIWCLSVHVHVKYEDHSLIGSGIHAVNEKKTGSQKMLFLISLTVARTTSSQCF